MYNVSKVFSERGGKLTLWAVVASQHVYSDGYFVNKGLDNVGWVVALWLGRFECHE